MPAARVSRDSRPSISSRAWGCAVNRPVLSLVFLAPHAEIRCPAGAEYAVDATGEYFVERRPDEHRSWIWRYRRIPILAVQIDTEWLDVQGWETCDEFGQPLP